MYTVANAQRFPFTDDGDWSSTDRILFVASDATGINQPWTMNPDGSDRRLVPTPNASRNTFNPSWHPSGEWFVVQRELNRHWLEWFRRLPLIKEALLNGIWSDLYVAKADGSAWFKMTRTTSDRTDGVLAPAFSPDGSLLMWSRLIKSPSDGRRWGVFRLMLADFSVEHGIPQATNVRDVTPEAMVDRFVEAHVISSDGRTALVSSDYGATEPMHMHVYRVDLDTLEAQRVSRDETWNEHAAFTPDGQHIVYMAGVPGYLASTDLVMVNLDGSGWTQLTHFNDARYPEYAGELVFAARPRFSPDGSRAVVTTQSVARYPARDLWIITLNGHLGMVAN